MGIFDFVKSIFGAKEEELAAPYKYARIVYNPVAKSEGVKDDWNKLIVIFEGGKPVERMPYSEAAVIALKKVDGIPVVEDEEEEEGEFEWDSTAKFGIIHYPK